MSNEINVYCDESCHLENDGQRAMVFGCLRCPKEKLSEISKTLRMLKKKHHIYPFAETKWKTVSKSKENFYIELLNYFLYNDDLKYRAVIFQNKDLHKLEHNKFEGQTYEDWYYKMFYLTLDKILFDSNNYNIYLDKKNPNSSEKLNRLKKYLEKKYTINKIQNVISHESELIQLTDFLTGILSYANRDYIKLPEANKTKIQLVNLLKESTGLSLISTTKIEEKKFNILTWEPNFNEK